MSSNFNQVSELLGSFGDNELSPECLDGAQRFLKPDGISIPSSYDLFLLETWSYYSDLVGYYIYFCADIQVLFSQ